VSAVPAARHGRCRHGRDGAAAALNNGRVHREVAMLVVTSPVVAERRTVRTFGLVSGEAILGANLFKDFFAGIRDIVGGRSAAYEQELRKAKEIALQEMENEADALGANAIVAVDLDYETISSGQGGSMLMVSVSGTAVLVE